MQTSRQDYLPGGMSASSPQALAIVISSIPQREFYIVFSKPWWRILRAGGMMGFAAGTNSPGNDHGGKYEYFTETFA